MSKKRSGIVKGKTFLLGVSRSGVGRQSEAYYRLKY